MAKTVSLKENERVGIIQLINYVIARRTGATDLSYIELINLKNKLYR